MKRIVIAYPQMMLGGSTTSLLSILNDIDKEKYDISLLLSFGGGPYSDYIPSYINVLPYGHLYQNARQRKLHMLLSPRYMFAKCMAYIIGKVKRNERIGWQYFGESDVDFYRTVEEEYDVAIAFLEGRMCRYVADHIRAKRKIAWIHIDYKTAGYDPKYDLRSLSCFDKIVLVSEKCKESFCDCFPELSDRTVVIENILSAERIRQMAEEQIDIHVEKGKINLVTTCRIEFESKGLDRAVSAFKRVVYENIQNIRWYIIGNGSDYDKLIYLIEKANLSKYIFLFGSKTNPYPYLKPMDLFFLPSRYEGKPMAVTEGFMLGLPALVTEYSSAREQVRDGVDGMVVENSEEGIYQALRFISEHQDQIQTWKENAIWHDYSNLEEMKKIEALIDGK